MSDFTVRRIDDMEAVFRGSFKRARAELGVESFGMQVVDLPPNAHRYPEHTHEHDGQEEVFIVLRGKAELELDGERHPIDPDTMVRVGPAVRRKLWTGDQPARLLVLGGCPGRPYEAPDVTRLGEPDPLAA